MGRGSYRPCGSAPVHAAEAEREIRHGSWLSLANCFSQWPSIKIQEIIPVQEHCYRKLPSLCIKSPRLAIVNKGFVFSRLSIPAQRHTAAAELIDTLIGAKIRQV